MEVHEAQQVADNVIAPMLKADPNLLYKAPETFPDVTQLLMNIASGHWKVVEADNGT